MNEQTIYQELQLIKQAVYNIEALLNDHKKIETEEDCKGCDHAWINSSTQRAFGHCCMFSTFQPGCTKYVRAWILVNV